MVPPNQFLLNDKVLLHTADISNSSHHQWRAFQYQNGFPIPFLPNLNAPEAERIVTTGAIDYMPCPPTPVTRDKRKTPMDTLPREVIDLVEENRGETTTLRPLVENQRGLCFSSPVAVSAGIPSDHQASQVHEALPYETSSIQPTATEENEHGGNDGIDLNETPQQKAKRKKHRPKVIREGKPSTTPKPKTPKPVTPKRAVINTDKPNGKRKYVRKKNLSDVNTPSPAVAEVVEPAGRGGTKSVRRSLNFDTEGGDTRDKSPGMTSMYKLNAESQAQRSFVKVITISPGTKSNVQLTQGPEVVVDSQAAIPFDLNLSAQPVLNEYISFPPRPAQNHQPSIRNMAGMNQVRDAYNGKPGLQAPHTPHHRRELIRENLNNLATENDSMEVFRNLGGSISDLLVTGSKRGHNLVDNVRASSHLKIVNAYNDIRHVSHLGETCKKSRTKEQVEFASYSSLVTSSSVTCDPAKSWDTYQMEPNSSADAQSIMPQRKLLTTEAMLSFRQTERMTTNRNTESVRAQYFMSLSDAVNRNQISIPENLQSRADDREVNGAYGIPVCMEPLIAGSQERKEPMIHRKKGQTQFVNSIRSDAKMISAQENGALSGPCSPAVYKSVQATPSGARKSRKKNSALHIQDCQSSSSFQESLNTACPNNTIPPYEILIEDIIRKLQYLEINKADEDAPAEAQNALVLYDGGVNKMVPHEGQLILIKKRRPRVKVDLDPETHRMWKLLMGKESTEGNDARDENKEKWWEEERRVFHGRADSFIARMHLVQGDRRFSQWKGSVVDSVVGVFLTQNVSDHLSSSAFMALAAKFPLRSRGNSKAVNTDSMNESACMQDGSILFSCEATKLNGKITGQEFAGGGADLVYESQNSIGKEIKDCSPTQCDNAGSRFNNFEGRDMNFGSRELEISSGSLYSRSHMSLNSRTNAPVTVIRGTSYVETEDKRSLEDIISSQSSVVSSQNSSEYPPQTAYQVGLALEGGTEAVSIMENMFNAMESSTSFTKLLEMADSRLLSSENSSEIDQLTPERLTPDLGWLDYHESAFPSMLTSGSFHSVQQDFMGQLYVPSASEHVHTSLKPRFVESQYAVAVRERSIANLPPSVLSSTDNINTTVGTCGSSTENTNQATDQQKWSSCFRTIPIIDLHASMSKTENCKETHFLNNDNIPKEERTGASLSKNISHLPLQAQDGHMVKFHQNERQPYSEGEGASDVVEVQSPMPSCKIYQMLPKSNENLSESAKVVEPIASPKGEVYNALKVDDEKDNNAKGRKVRVGTEKKSGDEWDSLRRQACSNSTRKEKSNDTMDSVDWDAVRQADVKEISETIRERGMNNMLAERIKEFLNRLVTDHGSIDLEWLRDIPPDKVKDYLLSIRGLGLKSVECVRLLTLHHVAFPVDTNVGRICVRLGWVPLQPLPESLQLHLLELYPVLETIQKYLWPRLCTLDQRTLYELHYQMITFGKVFCTKSKPNCNACPMRGECKHFASAFASARLALPGPEEKSLVSSTISTTSASSSNVNPHLVPLAQLEERSTSQEGEVHNICEPIIEEPSSPEPGCVETSESAIEDAFFEDPDEIPTIKLNLDMFTQNLQNYMQANNMEIQDGDMSRALVLLSSAAASIPMPKLKNVSRLRTEHLVYELPDSHPLLEGLDQRECDDPCPYLLAIWAPGETAQSTEPPNISCNFQETGRLCDEQTCFACNSKREAETQTVRGTLLIPCRTAMRGSFPLNGTYFQVNEVFADHDSSHKPIDVPREWIWNLPRRTVYFGTSIPTIFKGLSTEGIQHCFWRGFVCVRGFDRTMRAPKPLYARLHFPASKAIRNKSTATNHKV